MSAGQAGRPAEEAPHRSGRGSSRRGRRLSRRGRVGIASKRKPCPSSLWAPLAWARPSWSSGWPWTCSTPRIPYPTGHERVHGEVRRQPHHRLSPAMWATTRNGPAHRERCAASLLSFCLTRLRGPPRRAQHPASGSGRRPHHRPLGPQREFRKHGHRHDLQRGSDAIPPPSSVGFGRTADQQGRSGP